MTGQHEYSIAISTLAKEQVKALLSRGDIEELIEREIPKLSLPAGMGDAPVYQPHKRVSSGMAGGGNFKKKPYHQKKSFVKK